MDADRRQLIADRTREAIAERKRAGTYRGPHPFATRSRASLAIASTVGESARIDDLGNTAESVEGVAAMRTALGEVDMWLGLLESAEPTGQL